MRGIEAGNFRVRLAADRYQNTIEKFAAAGFGNRCAFKRGANAFAFRTTKLRPGAYVATITARDADGRLSKPVRVNFKIKSPVRTPH